jgi:hypothetical protein
MSRKPAPVQTSVYQWRPRTMFNIDPQVAGIELDKIKGHNSGEITPEAVVKAAEPETSPLHILFEWDDAKAAAQQRLTTAGLLIRSIVVTVTSATPSAPRPINVSVAAAPSETGAAAARVVSEAEQRAAKVVAGWDDLQRWMSKYSAMPEFAQIAGVLSALLPKKDKAA